jgi:hypothetical protein
MSTLLFTDGDIAAINAARTVLLRIIKTADDAAWYATRDDVANPQDFGRVAALADQAEWSLFQLFNTVNAHRVQPISENDLHNRQPEEAAV